MRNSFGPGEWYHCFSRGIDKRIVFKEPKDYERFLQLLYICNSYEKLHRSDLKNPSIEEVFSIPRPSTLVSIGAYCLMPNHFHLLLKEKKPGSISNFMRKLGTAYTMYFNIKYDRSGGLFTRPFRSRHVEDDRYIQRVIQYIHSNPAELSEPKWKVGVVKNIKLLELNLRKYSYSSLGAFTDNLATRIILDEIIFDIETQLPPSKMLAEAREYYAEYGKVTP